jgi:hypothetical protein
MDLFSSFLFLPFLEKEEMFLSNESVTIQIPPFPSQTNEYFCARGNGEVKYFTESINYCTM